MRAASLVCLFAIASPGLASADAARELIVPLVIVLPERSVADGARSVTATFELSPSGTAKDVHVAGPLAKPVEAALRRWVVIARVGADCRRPTPRISVTFDFAETDQVARVAEVKADGVVHPHEARVSVRLSEFPRTEQFGALTELGETVDGRVARAKVLPAYPLAASIRGITGSASVRFVVDAQGEVGEVEFVEELPSSRAVPGALRMALRDAARRTRFEPGAAPSQGCAAATFYKTGYLFEAGIGAMPRQRRSGG